MDEKVTVFNNVINDLFNKHAPFKKKYFNKFGRKPTWLTDDIRVLHAKRDCAYSEWKNEVNLNLKRKLENTYKTLRNLVNQKSRNSKVKVFNQEINSKIRDSKQFWKAAGSLGIHQTNQNKHNCIFDPSSLNDKFVSNNNSQGNEQAINSQIDDILENGPILPNTFNFQQVSESDIMKIVNSIKYTTGVVIKLLQK